MENRAATLKDIQDAQQATKNDILDLKKSTQNDTHSLRVDVDELKTEVHDIRETLEFMKENVVTRDEFQETIATLATKDDLRELSNKMTSMFDSFVKSHNNFVAEMAAYRHQGYRHEARLETIENILHINPAM